MEGSGLAAEDQPGNASPHEGSWYRFRDLKDGAQIATPDEWTPALLEVRWAAMRSAEVRPGKVEWTDLRLFCNGTALPLRQEKVAGAVRTVAQWPRSGPGRYQLRLRGSSLSRKATVSIWPQKISRGEYETLLSDLETELPVQVAIAFQRAGGLAGITLNHRQGTTLQQELVRLRRAIDGPADRMGLAQALTLLAERPHRVLATEERWVRRGRARRPSPDRLGQAFARPGNTDESQRLKRVPDVRTRHTADVYENRLVGQFARQVRLRLLRIKPLLRESSHTEAAQTAQGLLEKMQGARRQARFLDEVAPLNRPPDRASMVLQRRPLYRAIFEGYLDFQKAMSVTLETPELEAPLRNLPFLYQLWCTLHVIRVATDVAGKAGFRVERSGFFQRKEGVLTLHLGKAEATLVQPGTGARLRIIPERYYGSTGGNGLHSVSYGQRPDLAIEVTRPTGEPSVYLVDPKYKLDAGRAQGDEVGERRGSPKKPDIDKMHAYRDAIRDAGGKRVVEYAAILYPGATESFSEGLEAVSARPGQVGPLCRRVRRVVERALDDASGT